MSVNIKKDGELVKIANNISIVQADWNDRNNTNKNTCIKNQPDTIKTMADLEACQDENALAGAMAVVEALDYQNVARDMNGKYSTLEEFVEATNIYSDTPRIGRCHDISSTGWTNGAEPFSEGNQWYRYIIIYSGRYQTGNTNDIHGNGIFWYRSGKMYNVLITGNKDTGLTLTYEVLNKPTIKTRRDLMANTVSDLFPDAVAVKDAITHINVAKNISKSFATLEELLEGFAADVSTPRMTYIKDTGGWGPKGTPNEWYKIMVIGQDNYSDTQQFPTSLSGFIMSSGGSFWTIYIKGKKGEAMTAKYELLNTAPTVKGQEVVTMMNGATTNHYTKISKSGNVVHLYLDITLPSTVESGTVYLTVPYGPSFWYALPCYNMTEDIQNARVQIGINAQNELQLSFIDGMKANNRYLIDTTYICVE